MKLYKFKTSAFKNDGNLNVGTAYVEADNRRDAFERALHRSAYWADVHGYRDADVFYLRKVPG